jgi:hypothetical protein
MFSTWPGVTVKSPLILAPFPPAFAPTAPPSAPQASTLILLTPGGTVNVCMPDVGDVVDTSPLKFVPMYAVLTCEDVGPMRPVAPQLLKVYEVCEVRNDGSNTIKSDKMLLPFMVLYFQNFRGKSYKHFIHKSCFLPAC